MCELFSLHTKPAVMQSTINYHLVDTQFISTDGVKSSNNTKIDSRFTSCALKETPIIADSFKMENCLPVF